MLVPQPGISYSVRVWLPGWLLHRDVGFEASPKWALLWVCPARWAARTPESHTMLGLAGPVRCCVTGRDTNTSQRRQSCQSHKLCLQSQLWQSAGLWRPGVGLGVLGPNDPEPDSPPHLGGAAPPDVSGSHCPCYIVRMSMTVSGLWMALHTLQEHSSPAPACPVQTDTPRALALEEHRV